MSGGERGARRPMGGPTPAHARPSPRLETLLEGVREAAAAIAPGPGELRAAVLLVGFCSLAFAIAEADPVAARALHDEMLAQGWRAGADRATLEAVERDRVEAVLGARRRGDA